jgi:hypothetical protein
MPTRTKWRKRAKRLHELQELPATRRSETAGKCLESWRSQARWRARSLHRPPVSDLRQNPAILAKIAIIDPNGDLELKADWDRVCADSIAEVAGRHLTAGSRPAADRAR